jgi:hypothetical protein
MSELFVMPVTRPVTLQNMNYAAVTIGRLNMLVSVQWVAWGSASSRRE